MSQGKGVERMADFWEDCVIAEHTQEVAMSSNSQQMIHQLRARFKKAQKVDNRPLQII